MEEVRKYPALNTQEFVARWHTIVEEHLVTELADVLRPLASTETGGRLDPEQCAALSRHMAYALQVAGSADGGVRAALDYLRQAASTQQDDRQRAAEPEPTPGP